MDIGKKIKVARTLRGLTIDELCHEMTNGVSKMAISKYERGLMSPKNEVLSDIAQACKLDIDFFSRKTEDINMLWFRNALKCDDADLTPLEEDIKEAVIEYYEAERLLGIKKDFTNPLSEIKIKDISDAQSAANILRQEWSLGCQPIVSVFESLRINNIRVTEFYNSTINIDGVSAYYDGKCPFIFINTYKGATVERRRFTALHELGHIMLNFHKDLNSKQIEKLCNVFAGTMLIPSNALCARLGLQRDDINLEEFISIRNLYGISIAATIYRALENHIINTNTATRLYNDLIKTNELEKGWGEYPLAEIADELPIMKSRLKLNL